MADESENKGILITPRMISTILGVITLLGVFFSGVTVVNSYSYRLNALESDKVEFSANIISLTNKIEDLNLKIVDLTIALNRLQDRYEQPKQPNK